MLALLEITASKVFRDSFPQSQIEVQQDTVCLGMPSSSFQPDAYRILLDYWALILGLAEEV